MANLRLYIALACSLVIVALIIGAAALGYRVGARDVQAAWDKETKATLESHLDQSQGALVETRRLAEEAGAKYRQDLEAAVRASEERQYARVSQAVRQAAIDATTRQGAYVARECVVDAETFQKLQDQLGGKK